MDEIDKFEKDTRDAIRLANAAADLLAACEAVEEWWLRQGMDECGKLGAPVAIFMVRAAIAKAKGENTNETV